MAAHQKASVYPEFFCGQHPEDTKQTEKHFQKSNLAGKRLGDEGIEPACTGMKEPVELQGH